MLVESNNTNSITVSTLNLYFLSDIVPPSHKALQSSQHPVLLVSTRVLANETVSKTLKKCLRNVFKMSCLVSLSSPPKKETEKTFSTKLGMLHAEGDNPRAYDEAQVIGEGADRR